jgi:hypothetical protein
LNETHARSSIWIVAQIDPHQDTDILGKGACSQKGEWWRFNILEVNISTQAIANKLYYSQTRIQQTVPP